MARWPRALIYWAAAVGAGLLAIAAIAASAQAGSILAYAWRLFPTYIDWKWAGLVLVFLAVVAFTLALILRITSHRLLIILGLAAILRLAAVAVVTSPLTGDWARYNAIAIRIAHGGALFDVVPTGWPLALSLPYAIFGPHALLGGILNAAFGVACVWLVFGLGARTFGETAGIAGAYLLAVSPDQVFATPILGSDTLYALLITAAAAAIFVPGVRAAVLGGALLGASQYVRATTIYVLPAFLAVVGLLSAWRARILAVLLAAGIILLPAVMYNRVTHDEWSIATSRFGGWSLLVGTNQAHDGMYNTDDLALIGGPSAFGTDGADRLAQKLAIQRITSDPGGFAGLVVRKFNVLWGSGYWGIRAAAAATGWPPMRGRGLGLFAQVIYAAILVLAAMAGWRFRRQPVAALVIILVAFTTTAHAFLEVSDRYHDYLIPLLCLLAGVEISRRWGRFARAGQGAEAAGTEVEL